MPIYDYKCKCEKTFDKLVTFSERDNVKCECNKKAKRCISAPNLNGFVNGSSV